MKKLWTTVARKRKVRAAANSPAPAISMASSSTSTTTPSRQQQNHFSSSESALPSSHRPALNDEDMPPFGFKILYDPFSSDTTTVDIIAIHGLNGHREKTWTQAIAGGQETMWLRDWVPKSIPSARVVSYGYDARMDGPSHQTLSGHAQDFVVRLAQFRSEDREVRRPMIFVVHGTGGIVLQLALLEAFRANEMHLPNREAIKFSTYGIIFLGTPHQGLSLTSLPQAESNTAHILNLHLKPNSKYLEDLVTMFTPIRGYFDIKFVYETRPEPGHAQLMVLRSSAVLPGAANIEMLGLNRDHTALARFGSVENSDCQALVSMIINMAKKAPEAVEAHWHTKMLGVEANLKAIIIHMEEILDHHSQVPTNSAQPSNLLTEKSVNEIKELLAKHILGDMIFDDAMFGSVVAGRTGCTPGTRVAILNTIRSWALDQSETLPNIFWLAGHAGTGKSTIAHTIAKEFQYCDTKIIPSFFCSRQLKDARQRKNVIPMIASLLAKVSPLFGRALADKDFSIVRARPDEHILTLLIEPWEAAARPRSLPPILVVIDAVDELEHEGGPSNSSAGASLIEGLIQHADRLSGLKFLITSRHDYAVVKHCESLKSQYHLEDVDPATACKDIKTYITKALPNVSADSSLLNNLAYHSNGLFIYAATVVRLIGTTDVESLQLDHLKAFVAAPTLPGGEGNAIDRLYSNILEGLPVNKRYWDIILSVLWTVICAQEPLTVPTITALLLDNVKEDAVNGAIQQLHAVLGLDAQGRILTHHKSFPDFMLDPQRCSSSFVCHPSKQHLAISQACFNIMKSGLRFNICDLPSSFVFDKDVPNIHQTINDRIGVTLRYACQHWATHILGAVEIPGSAGTISPYLRVFTDEHLLFWIESMNLIQQSGDCAEMLASIINSTIIESSSLRDDLAIAEHLASIFATHAVHESSPHLYLSVFAAFDSGLPWIQTWRKKFPAVPTLNGTRQQGQLISTFQMSSVVLSLALSPCGKLIACGFFNGCLQVWNWRRGQIVFELGSNDQISNRVHSISFSPCKTHLVAGYEDDDVIQVWDLNTQTELHKLEGHEGVIYSVVYSPQGDVIASGSSDRTIQVWDANNEREPLKLVGHSDYVRALAFSPDGSTIVSGSDDNTVVLWDAKTGTQQMIFRGHTAMIYSVSFHPNGRLIASGSADKSVRLWNTEAGTEEKKFFHNDQVNSCAFSPDGSQLASGSDDQTVCVWDVKDGTQMLKLQGHSGWVWRTTFSMDGRFLISCSMDQTMRVWDVGKDYTAHHGKLPGHSDDVTAVTFSPSGNCIASCSNDGTVQVWDAVTGTELFQLEHKTGVICAAYSLNGKVIVSASDSMSIFVWDTKTGTKLLEIAGKVKWPCTAASPDGHLILAGSIDGTLQLWDGIHGTQIHTCVGHTARIQACSFSPDGKRFMSCGNDQTIRLWNSSTGEEELVIWGHEGYVWTGAFSPDMQKIVSGSDDLTVRVWNANDGKELLRLQVDRGYVLHTSFSTNGQHIFSYFGDSGVWTWDATTGEALLNLELNHPSLSSVSSAGFSPDGSRIISGLEDGTICVWGAIPHIQREHSNDQWDVLNDPAWSVSKDGWIMSHKDQRLMWLSPKDRAIVYHPRCEMVISQNGGLRFTPSTIAVRREWANIYCP